MRRLALMMIVATSVVSIWFGPGKMLANADEGLPFYNAGRSLRNYSSYFYDVGLGLTGAFNIPRVPFFWIISRLQDLGWDAVVIQRVSYFVLMIVPLLTLPLLVNELFGQKDQKVGLIAGLFYLLNLYSYSQIWTRFVMS